jgi:NAD(P)-dependent dehydrogenase (short-subunit alcohol dehydrogenase family)
MSRIMVVGGTGLLGSAVVEALQPDHDMVVVGHSSGEHQVDLASKSSIQKLFQRVGEVDHVVSAAGEANFGPLVDLSDQDFEIGLRNKLMGQVNLVRVGHEYVADGGSITLTTGVLSRQPMEGSAAISLVNAGVEGFMRAAALELGPDLRVNCVSPGWVAETLEQMGRDPSDGVPAAQVAKAYVKSLNGSQNGEVIEVFG